MTVILGIILSIHCKNNNQKLVYFHTKKRTRHIYTKIRTKIY
jgi:hypothetical protein